MPLDGGPAIADPFVRTAALVEMLEFRVRQIKRAELAEVGELPVAGLAARRAA